MRRGDNHDDDDMVRDKERAPGNGRRRLFCLPKDVGKGNRTSAYAAS
jgi:hypothetical protein